MKRLADNRGFSLVEVMVVVAIVGLMAGVVVLSLPSKSNQFRQSVEQTGRTLTALSRSSILSGQTVGVVFKPTGLAVMRLGDNGWVNDGTILKTGLAHWSDLSLVSLYVDDTEQSLSSDRVDPHVWFLPTGDYPSFTLAFAGDAGGATVSAETAAPVRVSFDNEP